MKKLTFTAGLILLLAGSSSLYAQNNNSLVKDSIIDTTRLKLQITLNPSFQNLTNKNFQLNVNNLFHYEENRIKRYLNIFNSVMAQFLLMEVYDSFGLDYIPVDNSPFFDHRNAFQYNFMKSRAPFEFKSDLYKATW